MTKPIHEQLSYQVRGVLYDVHNKIGPMLPEAVYNQAVVYSWQPKPAAPDMLYPELVNELLAALHRVHFELGSGFLHQIYRRAAMVQLKEQEIGYEYIKEIPIFYQNHHL